MKTKRCRRLAQLLCLILLLALFPVPALAEGNGAVSVGSAEAAPGATVSVAVTIDVNPGVMFLKVTPLYDESILTLTALKSGVCGAGRWTIGNCAVWDAPRNDSFTGEILTMVFTVAENAPAGDTEVSVRVDEAFNYDEQALSFGVTPGKVSVTKTESVGGTEQGSAAESPAPAEEDSPAETTAPAEQTEAAAPTEEPVSAEAASPSPAQSEGEAPSAAAAQEAQNPARVPPVLAASTVLALLAAAILLIRALSRKKK